MGSLLHPALFSLIMHVLCFVRQNRYSTIEESDLVILLISDSAMASNHEKVFSKLKKVSRVNFKTE